MTHTILVYTSPSRCHLYAVMPTVAKLAAQGHDVRLRTFAAGVAEVGQVGISARAINEAIEACQPDDWRARTQLGAVLRAARVLARRAHLEVDDLGRAIEDEKPDLVLVDVACWGAAAKAEEWGGVWAQFTPYILPIPTREAPPAGFGLTPGSRLYHRLRDTAARGSVRALEAVLLPRLNEVRRRVGAEPLRRIADGFTRSELTLSFTNEPLERVPADWPSSIRQVGFVGWDPPMPKSYLSLIPTDRPVVLVSTSSVYQKDEILGETALSALADDRSVFTVLTSPTRRSADSVGKNHLATGFASHQPILDRRHVVCVVCHGGAGITQRALAAHVPLCVVPFGRDQIEVAKRIEVAQVGVRLKPRSLSSSSLRKAIDAAVRREQMSAGRDDATLGRGSSDLAAELLLGLMPTARASAASR